MVCLGVCYEFLRSSANKFCDIEFALSDDQLDDIPKANDFIGPP
jgi:hypothetical protein